MSADRPSITDIQWVLSHQALPWLQQTVGKTATPALVTKLRKNLSPERVALVLEISELRERAKNKFKHAERMFFTRKSLEQATDQATAQYKAQAIAKKVGKNATAVDLCCGIGGDALALADTLASIVAVDSNPQLAEYAQANFFATDKPNAKAVCDDATQFNVAAFSAWHIDPDRRTGDKRTSQLEFSTPSADEIRGLLASNPNACIKLAPAAELNATWSQIGFRQWIGDKRSCKQQVLWTGDLAESPANERSAVVLSTHGADAFRAEPRDIHNVAHTIGRYVYEPYPPVLAANLHHVLADSLGAQSIDTKAAYYTSGELRLSPFWATFEVIATTPFRIKSLKRELTARNIGRLEVKKRGVEFSPAKLQRELSSSLAESATIIITPVGDKVMALITRRVAAETQDAC